MITQPETAPLNPIVVVFAALILLATTFHASMVLLTNMPDSAIKKALSPIAKRYVGPQVNQGWALFAPDIATSNLRVLVRGRTTNGTLTPWYDASLFFLYENAKSNIGVNRISEGLFHGSQIIALHPKDKRSEGHIVFERTAAMILRAYAGSKDLSAMQIEIDSHDVPAPNAKRKVAKPLIAAKLAWEPVPSVVGI